MLRDEQDGLLTQQRVTLNSRWDNHIENRPKLKRSTRTNHRHMDDKYVREEIGNISMASIKYSTMKKTSFARLEALTDIF